MRLSLEWREKKQVKKNLNLPFSASPSFWQHCFEIMRSLAWFMLKGMSQQKWGWQEKSNRHETFIFNTLRLHLGLLMAILLTKKQKQNLNAILCTLITALWHIIQVKNRDFISFFLDLLDLSGCFSQRENNSTVLGWDLGGARVTEQWEGEEGERDKTPLGWNLEYAKVSRTLTMKCNTAKITRTETQTKLHTATETHRPY